MTQSRKRSVKEAGINLLIGYTINWTGNILLLPVLWDKNHPAVSAHLIGLAFTIISFIRQYIIRRYMTKGDSQWTQNTNA